MTKSSGKRWWQPATPTAPVLEKTGQRRRPFRHIDPCLHSEKKLSSHMELQIHLLTFIRLF
ncbi:hypothetical protein [Delftia sp. ZNC0008]|uniref:hypothetical protein n=1 Tax=Delftia sp. ZNC0008 TaxID=1339242 RepID=UPI0012E047C7|nr:hypothetical protein [Delftia sp. ZNC0008]